MHMWGDWPDELFAQVGAAADYIGDFCVRWGRINVRQTKEKYGTARVYCSLGGYASLHGLLFPNYVYKHRRFPDWLWKLDTYYLSKVFSLFTKYGFGKWQILVYKEAYRRAIKKYPMIKAEILCGADYDELLEHLWTKEDYKKQRDEWHAKYEKYRDKHWRLQMRWDQLTEAVREGKTYNKKS